jgi:hypothetical protein
MMISPGSAPPSVYRQLLGQIGRSERLTSYDQLDEVVDSLAGLDEHHHPSWFLELLNKLLDAVGTDNGFALGLVLQEAIDLCDGSVEGHDSETVVSHVEDEILTHDGQANEAKVSPLPLSALFPSSRPRKALAVAQAFGVAKSNVL